MRFDERQIGGSQFLLDDDRLVARTVPVPPEFADQIVIIEMEAVGDIVQMVLLEIFPRENQAPGRMVVDNHTAIAIENLAARGHDRQRFDAVPLGALVVDFRALDLQFPEAGDQEKENRDRDVLECGHLGGGKTGVVTQLNLVGLGLRFELWF